MSIKAYINPENRILYKIYEGDVSYDQIIAAWEKIYIEIDASQICGVIIYYKNTSIKLTMENLNQSLEISEGHLDFLSEVPLAMVEDNTDIAYGMLYRERTQGKVTSSVFSTIETAEEWILDICRYKSYRSKA